MSEFIEEEELLRIVENRTLPSDGSDVQRLAKNILAARKEVVAENEGLKALALRVVAFAGQLEAWGYSEAAHQFLTEVIGTAQVFAPDYDSQAKRIASLEHDHKVMREALEKYRDEHYWIESGTLTEDSTCRDLWVGVDNGFDLARTALSSLLVKDGERCTISTVVLEIVELEMPVMKCGLGKVAPIPIAHE